MNSFTTITGEGMSTRGHLSVAKSYVAQLSFCFRPPQGFTGPETGKIICWETLSVSRYAHRELRLQDGTMWCH